MGLAHSPKIVTDGLAFIYDTGSGKSYKGEPTVNVVANPLPTAGWSTANAQGSAITRTYLEEDGKPFMRFSAVTNGSDYPRVTNSVFANSATITGTFSTSLEVRGTAGAVLRFRIYQNGSTKITNSITLTSEWTRYTFDNQTTGFNLNQPYFNPATSNATYDIRNIQVEAKGHSTQFVDGTRSATQGLLDLTNNVTINLSNVSFDSNAQMVLDGTDDTINTGLFSGRNPATDPFTIEAVVKSDTTSGGRMWVDATNNGSNQRLYCAHAATGTGTPMGIQGSGWSSSAPHDTDYHHYVIVMDGSVARLYNNGEAHSTKNYTSYQIQALNIGGRNTYRWFGDIPIFKLYDRALTAEEVAQNYNAFKGRFL